MELSNLTNKKIQEVNLRSPKIKTFLKNVLCFAKWNFLATSLKRILIFQEEYPNPGKQTKKSALKKFLVSCEIFVIFTAVKHKDILWGNLL